jgi:hypothetical protein
VKKTLAGELARVNGLAFNRMVNRKRVVQEYHSLVERAKEHPDYGLLKKVYAWIFVPLSLWPIDMAGLMAQLLQQVATGQELDEKLRLECRMLQEAPAVGVCRKLSEYEEKVSGGSYEVLIEAQHKFDQIEGGLRENAELKADWEAIRAQFDVDKYRNKIGVIRRRPVQERNFHAADWKFGWRAEAEQFENVFDVFCHKWDLYGMQRNFTEVKEGERDRPLLLKLTVNLTPHGTMIMIPRYWSFDPRRDLKWNQVKRWHRLRSATKQGRKIGVNQVERRREAEKARALWEQASAAGLKGERREQWVMGRMGWDPRTDESRLRRLLDF